ncbi:unnamed protein product, partial [Brassica rapa]
RRRLRSLLVFSVRLLALVLIYTSVPLIDDTEQMLDQAFSLVLNASSPSSPLSVTFLDSSDYLGLFPIAANEPILWEHIALLQTGSLENCSDAAASLISLARDNDRYTKLIIVQRGIGPLLTAGEQVSAAAHFTFSFFTRPKQVKRIEISDQHW